ncbi:hypothetical protein IMSAGC009_01391 [Lachnospiraceae bacterium]|nr:hypothetical protein IMSAGC009_01391 [Lachnospiraceae bacterium]
MKRIILFGLGDRYRNAVSTLEQAFDIVGISDNNFNFDSEMEFSFIKPDSIVKNQFDKILITSDKYFGEISEQLLNLGIYREDIISLEQAMDICDLEKFERDKNQYIHMMEKSDNPMNLNFRFDKRHEYPVLSEWRQEAGTIDDYFWQDLWGALRIKHSGVRKHFDIGSRIDGFIAHLVVAGIQVDLMDIRPLKVEIPNVGFIKTDATRLQEIPDKSIVSLSALSSLEHFGLGRYGDSVDPNACFDAFASIQRVMKNGGRVYLSLPIGQEHLEFNAHRVFSPITVIDAFNELVLDEFSVIENICNEKKIIENADPYLYRNVEGIRTGLFIFKKK